MTKKEKIASLSSAMTTSAREDGSVTIYHFTDEAPVELRHLFVEHYTYKDVHYEIFNRACDIMSEIYGDKPDISDDDATDKIYERASDSASYYTSTRLGYLDLHNEEEISQIMREYSERSISTACAIWYDKQVEEAAILIKDWINA